MRIESDRTVRNGGGKRTIYRVLPDRDEWVVRSDGIARLYGSYETKRRAVVQGRDLAKGDKPSRLVIHREDGRAQAEYNFGTIGPSSTK